MSYNGSGTYSLPAGNPVVSGTVVQSTWANNTMADIASTFNNTLPRDGQAPMTAQLKVIDGTVTVPGIAFNSDPATGLFRPGTNMMAATVSGVEVLRAKSNGAILIATTTDNGTSKLQVSGDVLATTFTGNLTGNVTGSVTGASSLNVLKTGDTMTGALAVNANISSNRTGAFDTSISANITSVLGITIGANNSGSTNANGALTGTTYVATAGSVPMTFVIGGSEKARLDTSGNVGIGITPSNRLDIQSSALSTTPLVVRNFSNGGTIFKIGNASNGNGTLQVLAGDGATSQMLLDSSGNLGIGGTPSAWSTSPKYSVIDIGNSGAITNSNSGLDLASNSYYNGTNSIYKTTGPANLFRSNISTGQFLWYTAPSGTAGNSVTYTLAMTLDASGGLLVGATSNPNTRHVIVGGRNIEDIVVKSTSVSGGGGYSTYYMGNSASDTIGFMSYEHSSNSLQFGNNGTEKFRVDSAGNLGVGTTTPASGVSKAIVVDGAANAVFQIRQGGTTIVSLYGDSGISQLSASGTIPLTFATNGTERMRITSAGVIQDAAGNELGYKGIPVAGSLVNGQCFPVSTGQTFNTATAGQVYSIFNGSASAITLTQGSGLTLRQGGTTNTGNRTLLPWGFATVWYYTSNVAVINGNIT